MAHTKDNTTTQRTFKHLSSYERGKIAAFLQEGYSQRKIAEKLGRSPSTINREIKKGTTTQLNYDLSTYEQYFPETGQAVYEKNRSHCGNKHKLLKVETFLNYAEKMILENSWSPDVVVGHALKNNKFTKDKMVSAKTLYNYIDQNLLDVKNIDLQLKVRRKKRVPNKRKHKRLKGKSIEERPETVDDRKEFGHWEIDTVRGTRAKDNVLLTITERTTRQHLIRVLEDKSSAAVDQAIKKLKVQYSNVFNKLFKTITADNGTEFTNLHNHDINVYYAHPYSAWERGTNERHNGLIRRFIPKGEQISKYTEKQIQRIQNWCNNYPRKLLNYFTPNELFQKELQSIISDV
ncbi:IS30-like element ISHahy11 family transposase [Halanaerobium hydrogeniformans]|uniref:Integrase catalytic region n=1 Tax=Halanaerobium hydrogeniformans TaxID=656519 RepID=E4RNL3_HALHG|nr:IS30-like element ISHahy11 family transposase [Halanaerobium hydrogeniformans]ADQ13548.1 Integrase catalytic region [Halanaerobium hydrogeniformans]